MSASRRLALFRRVSLPFVLCFLPAILSAENSWSHYDGFVLLVDETVSVVEDDTDPDRFGLVNTRTMAPPVQGYVLPFGHQEFSDALVIHLAADLFYARMAEQELFGTDRRIDLIEMEYQNDGDHWAIRVENRNLTWYYYLVPIVDTIEGVMSHVMLAPERPDDHGLGDLRAVIENIQVRPQRPRR